MYCCKTKKKEPKPYIYEALSTNDRLTYVTYVFNHTNAFQKRKIIGENFCGASCADLRARLSMNSLNRWHTIGRGKMTEDYHMERFCFTHFATFEQQVEIVI